MVHQAKSSVRYVCVIYLSIYLYVCLKTQGLYIVRLLYGLDLHKDVLSGLNTCWAHYRVDTEHNLWSAIMNYEPCY